MAGSHINTVDVIVMQISSKFDSLYRIFANDRIYIETLKLANPNVQVDLPESLNTDYTHFTLCNHTNENEGRVSDIPLAWPLDEILALHDNSPIDFYAQENKTTPFDAFVAFLAYLVYQKDSLSGQGVSDLRIEETVMDTISLVPRLKITLGSGRVSLGLMHFHENMRDSDKADEDINYHDEFQLQAYDTTPEFEEAVFSASFVHVCHNEYGAPLLLDLALHDFHGNVIFRTPCFPYVCGPTYSPLILNFLRVAPVARMFSSDDVEQRTKARQVAQTLFAYRSVFDADCFLKDNWRHPTESETMFSFLYSPDNSEDESEGENEAVSEGENEAVSEGEDGDESEGEDGDESEGENGDESEGEDVHESEGEDVHEIEGEDVHEGESEDGHNTNQHIKMFKAYYIGLEKEAYA
ncbi:hypothetical protein CYMTET_55203 [Cymbomonas tetramitiformis]|uniref:Uncharacterized protein n=1 Tax=Cymbomonas tetramitiformis TaxID=36881 RepID=A0AAE0EN41_9CHLO|nr:hypothetical protein CYMTET_55203 [Cymbomonas tetramitiformis]